MDTRAHKHRKINEANQSAQISRWRAHPWITVRSARTVFCCTGSCVTTVYSRFSYCIFCLRVTTYPQFTVKLPTAKSELRSAKKPFIAREAQFIMSSCSFIWTLAWLLGLLASISVESSRPKDFSLMLSTRIRRVCGKRCAFGFNPCVVM